jgi:uncharacterized repeat protein (TIGR02543 family)
VTKTSGNANITWNDTTKKLDIAAGLAVGTYIVTLNAANVIQPDAVFTFTLTVSAPGSGSNGGGGGGGGGGTRSCSVTFEANGGSAVASQSVESGKKAAKPEDPIKEGFTFSGWFMDSSAKISYDFDAIVTGNLKLYAGWAAKPQVQTLFTDVPKDTWYSDAVKYVSDLGLMIGTAEDKFAPTSTLTRGMIVTILYRLQGEPDIIGIDNPFNDIPNDAWFADAVKWGVANNIVLGYGNGKFGPNDPVTKEQLAVLLYRVQQSSEQIPPDILMDKEYRDEDKISGWAKNAVNTLTIQGLFHDIPGVGFNPQTPAIRAEVASVLYRFLTSVS